MSQPIPTQSLPPTERDRQRRTLVWLTLVALITAGVAAFVFRGELFGEKQDGPEVKRTTLVAVDEVLQSLRISFASAGGAGEGGTSGTDSVDATHTTAPLVTVSMVLRDGRWMLTDSDTLAEEALVAELLAAIRTARLDASPLATTQAAATELGLADTSPGVAKVWWSRLGEISKDAAPQMYSQHGKFRLSDSFVVHRFLMPRIPTTLKAWQAAAVSILTEAEAESVVAIELTNMSGMRNVYIPEWRVERRDNGAWLEVARTKQIANPARVASCLFYAQSIPVLPGPKQHVKAVNSRELSFSREDCWFHQIVFTLANGQEISANIEDLTGEGRPLPCDGLLTSSRLGTGFYHIGEVQLGELAPTREAILGQVTQAGSTKPNPSGSGNGQPNPGTPKTLDWQGITPGDYRFIVFPTMHRTFPGLMPTTQSDAEALKDAVEFIRRLSVRGMPLEEQMNQQAKNPTTHAGPDGDAPTLSDHPNGIPPAEVIAAAKLLEPNKHSKEPIVAEDGIYVVLRVK